MAQVPLFSRHVALGAKLGPFGGWEMPIEYPAGTVAEHHAVRQAVGIFDVSHMGKLVISGPDAQTYVNTILTNDLNRVSPGQAQYSMLCNDSGGVVDDLIVYLVSKDEVRIIPNASNASEVSAQLSALLPDAIAVVNNHLTHGILAIQGPQSGAVLHRLGLTSELQYMSFVDAQWNQHSVSICRTGYTGEYGFELVAPNDVLIELWDEVLANNADLGLLPCGLGARDTLRTEMGYVLHGQDISPTISPIQAKTGWAVGWKKESFVGRDALVRQREEGVARQSWGLKALERGIPRAHMAVTDTSGNVLGQTTSGTFSPSLQVGISLALLDATVGEGDEVFIDVRGRQLRAQVTKPPFVGSSPK